MTSLDLDILEQRMAAAEATMVRTLSEHLFRVGPETYWEQKTRPVVSAWRRLGYWWYGVREWIAVNVLRIDIPSEDD